MEAFQSQPHQKIQAMKNNPDNVTVTPGDECMVKDDPEEIRVVI